MILKDKVIIVTGVGPGMSGKIAMAAAAEGARVVMMARSTGVTRELEAQIGAAGGAAMGVQGDVTRREDCERVVSTAAERYGRVDGLVNSAFYHPPMASLLDTSDDEARKALDVILFGALNMVRAVVPAMKQAGGGSIVSIGTMAYRKPFPGEGAYAAAKAAMATATRYLASELGPSGIRVNQAVMGWLYGAGVQSYIQWQAQSSGAPESTVYQGIAANMALKRIPPDGDCGKTVLMLLSDYCSEVTGASLDVNGGEFMPS